MDKYGFIEFWNPTVEQLQNIIPYLEDNRTVAFVWVYGEPEELEDYSSLMQHPSYRFTQPFWLARTREEAYKIYALNRDSLIGGV